MCTNKKHAENLLHARGKFSGRIGYVLAVAGSAVGLGNIWRFPYLAAKYGGGMFLLVYLILMVTFGYVMIVSETALGRMTKKSPVGAFHKFGKSLPFHLGGWINAVIPMMIVPYYSVIGGWVLKYLFEYIRGNANLVAQDGYFNSFITSSMEVEIWFLIFAALVFIVILAGVKNGVERVSKVMMPLLILLAACVAVYSITRPGAVEGTYQKYLADRAEIFKGREDKFVCLMDLALMAMRKLKKEGKLDDQEESDEINACSIVVPVEIDGKTEEWLVNFKNETHNHPTEIEPFGGAATCLGGAIRDPLSGRTYVYQAMRVTGAADPTVSVKETLKGKLPQKKLVREAAHGYSSYGNQIGLATGYVKEIYHPDYVAKRMEIGAVMGAAPRKDVKRMTSDPGDIIILLGGRTGRDGIGGATGSSKVHTEASIEVCGAEVQKGNAPTERKIQRMFRRPEVSRLIKKCNDFGAGF